MHLHFLRSVLTSLPYPPPARVTSPSNCWVSRCYSRNAGEQFCWYSPFSRSEVLPLLATSDYLRCQSGQMSTVITSHPPSLPASLCSTMLFLSVQLFDIAKYQNWGFLSTSKLSCCMEGKSAFHFPLPHLPTVRFFKMNSRLKMCWNPTQESPEPEMNCWKFGDIKLPKKLEAVNFNLQYVE